MDPDNIKKSYLGIKSRNEELLLKLKRTQFLISMARLLIFVGGGIVSGIIFSNSVLWGIVTAALTLFFFLFFVKKFGDYAARIQITGNLIKINDNEIKALDSDFSCFDGAPELIDPEHDFSADIDLFGKDSLFQYLNRTVTGPGKSLLAAWLSDPYSLKDEIAKRQAAVRELSVKITWRQQFMAYGLDKPLSSEDIESLDKWLRETDDLSSSTFIRVSSIILPVTAMVILFLVIAGILPVITFLLIFVLNLMVVGLFIIRINRIHSMVSQKQIFLSSAGNLIKSFEDERFSSPVLEDIKRKLCSEEGSVGARIKELNNFIRWFDNRLNLFAGLILNGLLLWDFQCIRALEKWRRTAADRLPGWLYLLGEADALGSLGNYAFNNPDYCFPVVSDEGWIIDAAGLGHPLLRSEIRVVNDFAIGKSGNVVIITGANMAGKSTFLRTVAVNMLLALTGAPVCARKMKLTPLKLFTSMRTADSLSRNESYFYAELKRLKALKEKLEKGDKTFFILDEILKGTNSSDKSLGSKMFLRRLLELGGKGLIATHDISLGEMENEFPENVVNKCFEINIDGEKIDFDYLLRDGITRKMNAAVLMKQMGIV